MILTANIALLVLVLLAVMSLLMHTRHEACISFWFLRVCLVNLLIVYLSCAHLLHLRALDNNLAALAANISVLGMVLGYRVIINKLHRPDSKRSFAQKLNHIFVEPTHE